MGVAGVFRELLAADLAILEGVFRELLAADLAIQEGAFRKLLAAGLAALGGVENISSHSEREMISFVGRRFVIK